MSEWIYRNQPVITAPKDAVGFTYLITNITGKAYIGKKSLWSHRTKKVVGRKNRKHTIKESDWKTYYGSNEFLLEDVDALGEECFTREILNWYYTKKDLTYGEVEEQFKHDVLRAKLPDGCPAFYNRNILGKFYPSKIIDIKE